MNTDRAVHWVFTTWLTGWLDIVPSLAEHAAALRAVPVGTDAGMLVSDARRAALMAATGVSSSMRRTGIPPEVYTPVYMTGQGVVMDLVYVGMGGMPPLPMLWCAQQCARHAAMAAVLRPAWDAAMAALGSPDVDPQAWRAVAERAVETCVEDLLAPVADRLCAATPVWGAR